MHPAAAVAIVAALSVGLGQATPPILRRLPEPGDAVPKLPYAALATRGFAAGVTVASLAAGLLVVLLAPPAQWLAWTALSHVGVLSAAIDLRTTYLPRVLSQVSWGLAAAGAAVAAVAAGDGWVAGRAALGSLALGGFFLLAWRLTRGGIGFGDVRLMLAVGAVTGLAGWWLVLAAALAGTVIGAVWGVVQQAFTREREFPYGPALLAGPFAALVAQVFLAR